MPREVAAIASGGRALVLAHRGASAVAPENTLEAFRSAAELGADWVELDVRTSADGVAVLSHDAELPDGRLVLACTRAELPDSMPDLADALAVCAGAGLGVNVEIKRLPTEPDADPALSLVPVVAEVVVASGLTDVLVTSFDPACIARMREVAPALPTGRLAFDLSEPDRLVAATAGAGHVALNPWDPLVTAGLVGDAHDAGLAVYPWTVDDPDRMGELVALGVDGIITNVPDVARTVVG